MISVTEAARMLDVTPARVRKLIADGRIRASKVGNRWIIAEEEIISRRHAAPRGGRPSATIHRGNDTFASPSGKTIAELYPDEHALYLACRKAFSHLHPIPSGLPATDKSEINFYMALADFFLQEQQRDLVRRGVF